jgi:crotonobetainyl-CoA:carnitine CoA-transferase CaiB-like acyl-CoA transferase
MAPGGPLAGLVVLDLTRLLPGAVATQILADAGAEVIKVEQPGTGDYARTLSPEVFATTNRGKKSVTLDLKQTGGREALLGLARTADVLVESFRPGVMRRLGLGYEVLAEINPRLVYASITGYGQSGEYSGLAGHDLNYLALGGVLGLNLPVIPGVQIADIAGGALQAALRISMALAGRERSGCGTYLDISMLAGVHALLEIPLAVYRRTGEDPRPSGEMLSGRYACYNVYETGDGRWLAVGALEPKFWAELCTRLGCEDLIGGQFDDAGQAGAKVRLTEVFAQKPAEEWFAVLRQSDCCVTPVRTISEVARELQTPAGRPPGLGEHNVEILGEP